MICAPRSFRPFHCLAHCIINLVVLGPAALPGQDDPTRFELGFSGPTILEGVGGVRTASYFCTLTHSGSGEGAAEWAISIGAHKGFITSITVEGTAAQTARFQRSEITGGAEKEGAISVVILGSENQPLAPKSTQTIAKIEVAAFLEPSGGLTTLLYEDGRRGSDGQPVTNRVLQRDDPQEYTPSFRSLDIVHLANCPSAELNLGFSSKALSNSVPFEGILGAVGVGGEYVVPAPAGRTSTVHVYSNVVSELRPNSGVQGWAMGISVDGEASPTSATTAGTTVERLFSQGFNKTEVIIPARNRGQRGVITAVVLSFVNPVVLPPKGTESVVDIGLTTDRPQDDRDLVAKVQFHESLMGSGQPVQTGFTVEGSTLLACNTNVASLEVRFIKAEGIFLRGNSNGDAKVNIADAIWILDELFYGGHPFPCEKAADANGDGTVDISDATYLVRYQFFAASSPPPPFPNCGVDPRDGASGGGAPGTSENRLTCLSSQLVCR